MESGALVDYRGYTDRLKAALDSVDSAKVDEAVGIILGARNKNIFIFGNGGSGTTASHSACDFNKTVSDGLDDRFTFKCLNDSVPMIMAVSNDIGYDEIFRFQLTNKLRKDDVVIALSSTGNSKNVIKALDYAKKAGAKIITLTGYDGGEMKGMADCPIHVSIDNMQMAEDSHLTIMHTIATIIANRLGTKMC